MSRLVDAHTAAAALGVSPAHLRVLRFRNPTLLPVVCRGPHGIAMYRLSDVQHAHTVVVALTTASA